MFIRSALFSFIRSSFFQIAELVFICKCLISTSVWFRITGLIWFCNNLSFEFHFCSAVWMLFWILNSADFNLPCAFSGLLRFAASETHKAGKSSKGFGFDVDNTIGSTPQINIWSSDWIHFYGEHRLGYQLKLALDQYGDGIIYEKGQSLVKSMGLMFDNVAIEPCLPHGDLWGRNISSDKNRESVILDQHVIMDTMRWSLGMSWCAGFRELFYNSYFEMIT